MIDDRGWKPVVNMIATLKARVEDSRVRQKALEDSLSKTRVWASRWKKKCARQKARTIDFALDLMEGQEILLTVLSALEDCLSCAHIKLENGKIALLIDDHQRLLEFSQIITQTKETIAECIAILASEFPSVPDIAVETVVPVISVCKPLVIK